MPGRTSSTARNGVAAARTRGETTRPAETVASAMARISRGPFITGRRLRFLLLFSTLIGPAGAPRATRGAGHEGWVQRTAFDPLAPGLLRSGARKCAPSRPFRRPRRPAGRIGGGLSTGLRGAAGASVLTRARHRGLFSPWLEGLFLFLLVTPHDPHR